LDYDCIAQIKGTIYEKNKKQKSMKQPLLSLSLVVLLYSENHHNWFSNLSVKQKVNYGKKKIQ